MCKKSIPNAIREGTFYSSGVFHTITDKILCDPCKKSLEQALEDAMKEQGNYKLSTYQSFLKNTLAKTCK